MPEPALYTTLEELKVVMGPTWSDSYTAQAERLIAVASAGLRRIFKNYGMDLDALIASGDIESILLSQTVADMVARNLSMQTAPLGGDFSQFSQSAGGYSISVSGGGGNLYLKREQAKWLGLPSVYVTEMQLFQPPYSRGFDYNNLLQGEW